MLFVRRVLVNLSVYAFCLIFVRNSSEITATVLKLEEECVRCGKAFTFWLLGTRRHHCRCCWRAYCSDCSSKRAIVRCSLNHLLYSSNRIVSRSQMLTLGLRCAYAMPALRNLAAKLVFPLCAARLVLLFQMLQGRSVASCPYPTLRLSNTWGEGRLGKFYRCAHARARTLSAVMLARTAGYGKKFKKIVCLKGKI
jgi:hypothetical protein